MHTLILALFAVSLNASAAEPPSEFDRWEASQAFRVRHLELRGLTSWHGGGATVIHSGWGWGWGWGWGPYPSPYWGLGTSYIIREPMQADHSWAVFQGVQRMTVPGYLTMVADLERAEDFDRRISRNENAADGLRALGFVGIAGTVMSYVGASRADTWDQYHLWNTVSAGSLGSVLVGFLGSTICSGQVRSLRSDFRSHLDPDDEQRRVDAYNEELRVELGLSKDEAWQIIQADERNSRDRPPRW